MQTNEDNLDRDIQTDEIETKEMWCQHPQEGSASCGGDNSNNAETYEGSAANQVDDVKLSSFLQRACQVCSICLFRLSCLNQILIYHCEGL